MSPGSPRLLVALAVLLSACAPMSSPSPRLAALEPGKVLHGFETTAVYTAGEDEVIGARFTDQRTGLVLHVLRFQSVPQAYLWVNTFPASDHGEPHTQEHLLLGKGNRGRTVASLEEMSLAGSSAYTTSLRTCYHFNTTAGASVFWRVFEARLDALLHPDYSNEEIRREVRHFGVDTAEDGTLRLEEKGTVYQEMVSTYERADAQLWLGLDRALFGSGHPLAFSAGGTPEGIRQMTVEDIRTFHRRHYHLGNMGLIVALPGDIPLDDALGHLQTIFARVEKNRPEGAVVLDPEDLPHAHPVAAPGSISFFDYPHENAKRSSTVMLNWPPPPEVTPQDSLLMDLLLGNIVGDETSSLYKRFIDSNTRTLPVGATSVWGGTRLYAGRPLYMGLSDVPFEWLQEDKLGQIRDVVIHELQTIADWPDGSDALLEFNERARDHVTSTRRSLDKFVNSPPGFGSRSAPTSWMDQLQELSRTDGFRKSVTWTNELAEVEAQLTTGKNIWREQIRRWRLLDTAPFIVATRANPALRHELDEGAAKRRAAFLDQLEKKYGTSSDRAALKRYAAEQDEATAQIERTAEQVTMPRFIDDPPLNQDDRLDYTVSELRDHIPVVTSHFAAMRSGTVGLALRVDGLREDQLLYLSMLTELLNGAGIHGNGETISYADMKDRLRREVLSVSVYRTSSWDTGRAEIIFWGQGNDLAETKTAIGWMERMLMWPDFRPENVGRLRDLIDQRAQSLRNTMQGAEEYWVQDPAAAYRGQRDPVLMHMGSFLTQAHDVHRMRWLLRSPGKDAAGLATWLEKLGALSDGKTARKDLESLLSALADPEAKTKLPAPVRPLAQTPGDGKLARLIAEDLTQHLNEIPDATLAPDWAYLCRQIGQDLARDPADVLRELDATRAALLRAANARAFLIGSPALTRGVHEDLQRLTGHLEKTDVARISRAGAPVVLDALRARHPDLTQPTFVGLVNPNTGSGVFVYSADGPRLDDLDRNSLLDYLAARLYSGGGAHSLFMKTWGAGLAYSNGINASATTGRVSYYAERSPKLSQTMSFVTDELGKAKPDPSLTEYAIAQVFTSRAASSYETRGASMAGDLADGHGPDVIRRYREALLALRGDPKLTQELFERMPHVYGRVLAGYGPKLRDAKGGNFVVIAPEHEIADFETWLHQVEDPATRVYRLYPRDFWIRLPVDKS